MRVLTAVFQKLPYALNVSVGFSPTWSSQGQIVDVLSQLILTQRTLTKNLNEKDCHDSTHLLNVNYFAIS